MHRPGRGTVRLGLQLFTESLVFAIAASAVGVGVATVGTRALLALLPRRAMLPRLDSVEVDLPVLAFVCGLTVLVSLLLSLIPVLRPSRNRTQDSLKVEGRAFSAGKGKRRFRTNICPV